MSGVKNAKQRDVATQVLESNIQPIEKVRQLVGLGYDEEAAERMVTGTHVGFPQALYYEQLPSPDYE